MGLDALPNDLFLAHMKNHKLLLCKLYKASRAGDGKLVRFTILQATDGELKVVLEVLRRIAVREIRLSKNGSEKLVRSRRSSMLRRLANSDKYDEISRYPRAQLTKFLCSFSSLYVHLFHYLFNLD